MKSNLNGAITCVAMWHELKDDVRDELGTNRYRKSPKLGIGTGIEYTWYGTVHYLSVRYGTGI
ncbi:hypothetical protein HanPSC8_Chr11g0450611 [Helianthus annuus]|nr:hypothetical protein HanPSC8_Chr11g0450611 [Helianthus annuus]